MTATDGFYEWAHGKRIRVKYLDAGPIKARRKARLKTTWGRIPHDRGLELAKAAGNPLLAVLLALEHAVHWAKSNRVKLSNDLLQQYGISSRSKLRGLRQLERAGVVKVEWRGTSAPIVTHLWYTKSGTLA